MQLVADFIWLVWLILAASEIIGSIRFRIHTLGIFRDFNSVSWPPQ